MAIIATFAMIFTGCKSTSAIKSPFASNPDPHIASPAEMDDLQLKAPPESYTKANPKSSVREAHSLAQQGEYKSTNSRSGSVADQASAPAFSPDRAPSAIHQDEPLRTAMNHESVQDNIPADTKQGNYSSIPSTGSTYPDIPGLSYGSTSGNSSDAPAANEPGVFAPGSIGTY